MREGALDFHPSANRMARLDRGRLAQLVRALPSHGRGRWFKSSNVHQSSHSLAQKPFVEQVPASTMQDFNFNCPQCGQNLDAPGDMAGLFIECPACRKVIQVPRPEGEPPSPATQTSPGIEHQKSSTMRIQLPAGSALPTQRRRRIVIRRPPPPAAP